MGISVRELEAPTGNSSLKFFRGEARLFNQSQVRFSGQESVDLLSRRNLLIGAPPVGTDEL